MNCNDCKEIFDDKSAIPLNLKCGHSICKNCIINMYEKNKSIICSICKMEDKISKPENLSKNFIALNYGCQQKEIMKKYKFCTIHKLEPVKFFCQNCHVTFCAFCIVNHSGHKFSVQNISVEKLLSKITTLENKIELKINKVKKNLELEEQEHDQFLIQKKKNKKIFDEYYNISIGNLERKYKEIIKDILSFKDNEIEKIKKQKISNKLILKSIETIEKDIESSFNLLNSEDPENSNQIVDKITVLKNKINKIYSDFDDLNKIKFEDIYKKNIEDVDEIENLKEIFNLKLYNSEPCFFMMDEEKKILIYHLKSNKWSAKNLPLESMEKFNKNISITAINENTIALIGGNWENNFFFLNINNLTLTKKKSFPTSRTNLGSLYFKNKLYILGGYNEEQKTAFNKCQYYDLHNNKWYNIKSMGYKRMDFGACVFNDNYIIVAGGNDNINYVNSIEKYNIKEDKWEVLKCKFNNYVHKSKLYKFSEKKLILTCNPTHNNRLKIYEINLELESIKSIKFENPLNNCFINIFYNHNLYLFGGPHFSSESTNLKDNNFTKLERYYKIFKTQLENWNYCIINNYLYENITELNTNEIEIEEEIEDLDNGSDYRNDNSLDESLNRYFNSESSLNWYEENDNYLI